MKIPMDIRTCSRIVLISLLMWMAITSLFFSPAFGQDQTETLTIASPLTAFVNVNVIPMDVEHVLESRTVIVEDDRIISIELADGASIPEGAEVIEGNGAYLLPGLGDMHAHLELRDRDPGSLLLFLAQGTTTVRSPSG